MFWLCTPILPPDPNLYSHENNVEEEKEMKKKEITKQKRK